MRDKSGVNWWWKARSVAAWLVRKYLVGLTPVTTVLRVYANVCNMYQETLSSEAYNMSLSPAIRPNWLVLILQIPIYTLWLCCVNCFWLRLSTCPCVCLYVCPCKSWTRSSATAEIARVGGHLRRSSSLKVTDFGTDWKPVCDFVLVSTEYCYYILSLIVLQLSRSIDQIIAFDRGCLSLRTVLHNIYECRHKSYIAQILWTVDNTLNFVAGSVGQASTNIHRVQKKRDQNVFCNISYKTRAIVMKFGT